ncbi:putative radical SAM enzyme, TIGR03279 family [Lachnospiraceae bacterium XBB1006]|nr:putative radical SAM enzyme, TIGR03279 family [Lachnospiraceae bacterium XBB1006]
MKKQEHTVKSIAPGSIAEELGIEPGDRLVEINGQKVKDVFDYHYLCNEEFLTVVIEKPDGEEWEFDIEKEYEDDLGIEFENGMMDDYRSCSNKCIFCFIDQMPPGMRETLYFKDDDSRLSFLQGNYVTLTNMSEEDVERIITYKMSPINVSVQTMNPELRCMMLHNRFAGEALKKIYRFAEAGIVMNGQIVLCKGVNDGAELEYSLQELFKLAPAMQSVSVVPVGLSKYREGLYPLEPFNKEEAGATIDIIEKWQKIAYDRFGFHFAQASDEWYLLADRPLPEEERYDGFLQLENGVGMITLLEKEFSEALAAAEPSDKEKHILAATGRLIAPTIAKLSERVREKFPNVHVRVKAIRNDFFGERITVAGLITGQDLIAQVKDDCPEDTLLIPISMLRSGEETLLDDYTVSQVSEIIGKPIRIVKSDGADLLQSMIE